MAAAVAIEYFGSRCIQCGKCRGGCPIAIKSKFNVRLLVYRSNLIKEFSYAEPDLWDCSCCNTCSLRCPKQVQPMNAVIGMRSKLMEQGRIPATLRNALESAYIEGNPWGRARAKRFEWAAGLNLKHASQKPQLIYYVGCTPCYDPRVQRVARSLVDCFKAADLDFGVLGESENCCGNEIKRLGELGLFELLRDQNKQLLEEYQVNWIAAASPHCYNAFKNEYGLDLQVQHYTQLICELIDNGKLKLEREFRAKVAYHDPCLLGKQNKIYDQPRKILESIPGLELIEFSRARENSLCCEGGGGRMWVEASDSGIRLAELRVEDALDQAAQIIAVACPFCLLTLEDAVKTMGKEEQLKVMDIAEILSSCLKPG